MRTSHLIALVFVLLASGAQARGAGRDEARALLNDGRHPMEAVRAYESFSSSTSDAGLVAERSLSLAAAGLNEAALQEMDRAFLLDPTDDEVLYSGSTLLAYLGLVDAATELARPQPSWVTRQPLLPPRGGSKPHWDAPSSMREIRGALASAGQLMQKGRYLTAADRLARIVASNPKDPTAWAGFAVALESLGAFRSAAHAVAAELYVSGQELDPGTRRELEEHQKELEAHPPVMRPRPVQDALEGRYTLFAGGSLTGGAGGDTSYAVTAQAGKFITNRLNLLLSAGYVKSSGTGLGLGLRYYLPIWTWPARLTAGSRLEYDSAASGGKLGWLVSPGLSWFVGTNSIDLIYDLGVTGSQNGNRTFTVGMTFYMGGSG